MFLLQLYKSVLLKHTVENVIEVYIISSLSMMPEMAEVTPMIRLNRPQCIRPYLKKACPLVFVIITLANVNRFSKFFHELIRKKILYAYMAKISTSPAKNIATLPCECRKSKNVTDFDSIPNTLLTLLRTLRT